MTSQLLSDRERVLLTDVCGKRADHLIWDLNAIYVVLGESATKIEAIEFAVGDAEVVSVTVSAISNPGFSNPPEEGLAYRVVASAVLIDEIWLVRGRVSLPYGLPIPSAALPPQGQGCVTTHIGVLLGLGKQCIPAIQLNNSWGFHLLEPTLYDLKTTVALLRPTYELERLRLVA